MPSLTITRSTADQLIQENVPYTVIPNFLIYCAELGLKPRDTAVFNYLYSQNSDKFKYLQPAAISNALGIGVSTVRRALSNLVKANLASYQRYSDGKTAWKVSLPDLKPHSQKPHADKPQVENSNVLTSNNLLDTNKETTTAVVVSLPDYVNDKAVKYELSQLESAQQALVLSILTSMMSGGGVKNPVRYVLGLISKAKNGLLTMPVMDSVDKSLNNSLTYPQRFERDEATVKQNQQAQRISKLKSLMPEIKQKMGNAAHVIAGGEIILKAELVQLGLI